MGMIEWYLVWVGMGWYGGDRLSRTHACDDGIRHVVVHVGRVLCVCVCV